MSSMGERFTTSYKAFACIRGLNAVIENDIIQFIKKYDLSFPSFRTLWILYFDTKLTMSDLTYLVQTNISNAFRQLTKLNEAGLVKIEAGKTTRAKELTITEEGRVIVKEFIEEHVTNSNLQIVKILEKIPEEDLSKFMEVVTLLTTELLGQTYTDWFDYSADSILKDFN
ncbi:MarR family winged helix-turn-helix transcriptional regulator [Alkalihalobacterium alkalinitrilicum]|uniref:MarR family winged helix-turn-helix transcriptional regulator n=1 Tax=Alkalihalobacterium alkalinitrilicum TaxID=427920 RepID=UPI0011545880|nr:hypothetical protein [Alkalihalobacterium alkalinitrilicum]